MVKVLYDNQVFSWQKCGGISRSFYEIISNLDNDIQFKLPIYFTNNLYLKDSQLVSSKELFPNKTFFGKDKLLKIPNYFAVNNAFRSNYDVFHPTYFDPYFLSKIKNKPFVLTIHDMIPEKFPQFFPVNYDLQNNKRLLAEKSSRIIAVSEMTKNDIINLYGIDSNKISVIYHGSSLNVSNNKSINLPAKYILFVGVRSDYKNFISFYEAFIRICQKEKDLFLICTGNTFTVEEKKMFENSGLLDRVMHYYVEDSKLSELYSSATLFIFPSLYEGFGIPILEAFASRCPVLLSNIDCFVEVADEAAFYFNPLSVDSIYETLLFALENKEERENKIELGFKRLKDFTWKKAGQLMSNLYRTI